MLFQSLKYIWRRIVFNNREYDATESTCQKTYYFLFVSTEKEAISIAILVSSDVLMENILYRHHKKISSQINFETRYNIPAVPLKLR